MGNEARQPGLPSGFDSILEIGFGVSAKPMVRRDEAITRVQQKVATDKLTCQRLCISEMPVDRDTLFDMTGRRVPFPETAPYDRCYVALLDSEIVAPWGHPALWAFIPVDAQSDILFVPTQFPENAKGSIRFVEVPR